MERTMKNSKEQNQVEAGQSEETVSHEMDRRDFLGLGAIAAAGALALPSTSKAQPPADATPYTNGEVVEIESGRIRGSRRGNVHAFRGVPYGAPTGGNNRFLPASKVSPWNGVRDALDIGDRAPQTQRPLIHEWGVLYRLEPSSEDCLVLNVWSKGLNDNAKRPVMVWLHGGGFSGGSSGGHVYDGTNMANEHDVVFVGINHRLNAFGFLYLPEIGGEKYSQASNVGMLDIVMALEWVRDNIEIFGGDPDNVTILGQSGGGAKVSTLLGMPAAQGLFHKAIAQSGSQVRSITADRASETARNVMRLLEINNPDDLQDVPFYILRDALAENPGVGGFGPVVDGSTLPSHIFDPTATTLSADVPLMIGSTETEVTWLTGQSYDVLDEQALRYYVSRALRTNESDTNRVINLYRSNRPEASNLDLYLIIATDASGFRQGTDQQAERKAALGRAAVYKYYYNWYSPVRDGELRAMHCMDIPFALNNVEVAAAVIGSGPEQDALANIMSTAWASFARTGNPSHSGMPQWRPFTNTERATMLLNPEPELVNDPRGEEMRLINSLIS
jgi:para-nitrobenzyl esterase